MRAVIPLFRRHALSLLVTTLAFIFTLMLWPFGHRFPFALFIAAVLASAWQGGPRAAIVTTALSAATLFGLYFLLPAEQIAELGFDYLTRLALFIFVGLVAGFLCYQYQQASRSIAEAAALLANASVAVILVDRRGRVTSLNAQAEALTGWTAQEALGRQAEQVFHLRSAGGEPLPIPAEGVLQDGSTRPLPKDAFVVSLSSRLTPVEGTVAAVHDSADRLTGLIISFRNVSDREQAEAAARSREAGLQAQLAEQSRAGEAWMAERQELQRALAAEQQSRRKLDSDLQAARADLDKVNQALAAGRAQADEAMRQLRADHDKRLDEQALRQAQAEAALREARIDHEGRLAEMSAGHEQDTASLRQAHAELSEKLAEAVGRHGETQEALQSTQAQLLALQQQHQAAQAQAADAAQQAQAEAEGAARQIHSDWEKRLAEQQAEHGRLHAALERELADHQELLKELDREQQTLRQERDLYLSLLIICGIPAVTESFLPAPRAEPAAPEPALAAPGNGAGSGPDGRTDRLDWLSFN